MINTELYVKLWVSLSKLGWIELDLLSASHFKDSNSVCIAGVRMILYIFSCAKCPEFSASDENVYCSFPQLCLFDV